jgi:tellurite resistance protein
MSTLAEKQLKEYSKPSNKTVPIVSLKNFDQQPKIITSHTPTKAKSKKQPEAPVTQKKETSQKTAKQRKRSIENNFKFLIVRKEKKYGPYGRRDLVKLYKMKKISKRENLVAQEDPNFKVTFLDIFRKGAPGPEEMLASFRVLNFSVSLSLSDGNLDADEFNLLEDFCYQQHIPEGKLEELIQFHQGKAPPPIELKDSKFRPEDFRLFVDVANADGEVSMSELRMLKKVLRKLQETYPDLRGRSVKDYLL